MYKVKTATARLKLIYILLTFCTVLFFFNLLSLLWRAVAVFLLLVWCVTRGLYYKEGFFPIQVTSGSTLGARKVNHVLLRYIGMGTIASELACSEGYVLYQTSTVMKSPPTDQAVLWKTASPFLEDDEWIITNYSFIRFSCVLTSCCILVLK